MNNYEKYLLPWKQIGKVHYERKYLVQSENLLMGTYAPILITQGVSFGRLEWVEVFFPEKGYNTAQELMDAIDGKLRREGFTLLTEEQADRLQLLV